MVDVHTSSEAKIAEPQQDNRDIWDAIDQFQDLHDRQKSDVIYTMKNNVEFLRQKASLEEVISGRPREATARYRDAFIAWAVQTAAEERAYDIHDPPRARLSECMRLFEQRRPARTIPPRVSHVTPRDLASGIRT